MYTPPHIAYTCVHTVLEAACSSDVAALTLYTWICSPPTELPWWLSGQSAGHVSWRSLPLGAVQLFSLKLADYLEWSTSLVNWKSLLWFPHNTTLLWKQLTTLSTTICLACSFSSIFTHPLCPSLLQIRARNSAGISGYSRRVEVANADLCDEEVTTPPPTPSTQPPTTDCPILTCPSTEAQTCPSELGSVDVPQALTTLMCSPMCDIYVMWRVVLHVCICGRFVPVHEVVYTTYGSPFMCFATGPIRTLMLFYH